MLEKLAGLPLKHIVGKFVVISLATSLAETLSDQAYSKAFKLPIKK